MDLKYTCCDSQHIQLISKNGEELFNKRKSRFQTEGHFLAKSAIIPIIYNYFKITLIGQLNTVKRK